MRYYLNYSKKIYRLESISCSPMLNKIQDEFVWYLTFRSNLENDIGLERAIAYTKIIQEKPDKMPKDDEIG